MKTAGAAWPPLAQKLEAARAGKRSPARPWPRLRHEAGRGLMIDMNVVVMIVLTYQPSWISISTAK